MRGCVALFAIGIAALIPVKAAEVYSGVTHHFTIPPQDEEVLLTDLTFTVIPGSKNLTIEVETDDFSDDVDLFVRFGLPPAEQGGTILADYSSTTAGSGDEEIKATANSNPPLQTGIYHIGLLVKTLDTEIAGTILATTEKGGTVQTFIVSTFENLDDEGWTRNFPASDLPGSTSGDFGGISFVDPAGFIRYVDTNGPSRDFAVAPAKFLGDLSQFTDARFEFDYRHSSGFGPFFKVSMILIGADSAYTWVGTVPPNNEWTHFRVELIDSEWSRTAGSATFTEVLQDTQRIELSMDQSPQGETNDLDNFALIGGPPSGPTGAPDGPRSSTFEFGLDGWTRNYPPVAIPGATIGSIDSGIVLGNPGKDSMGFLKFVDSGQRSDDYAVAPRKFLGNLSTLDRPWFEFDYRHIEGAFSKDRVNLRLVGLETVYTWASARARSTWQHFRVPLNKDNWVRFVGEAAFNQVLANLQRVEVSMDLADGPEVNGLDNFHLRTEYVSPSGRALFIVPDRIVASGSLGGAPIEPLIVEVTGTATTVDWRASVRPESVTWLYLNLATGTTPSALELNFDPAGLGAGVYEAEVLIREAEFGVPRVAIPVTLVLDDSLIRPRISQGGVVHSVEAGLPLSPGVLATVFGDNFAPAEQEVGFVPGTTSLLREALGVKVLINFKNGGLIEQAPLLYVGPKQVNFQMPFAVAGRPSVEVVVMSNDRISERTEVLITPAGPGLFVFDGNRAAVVNQDGALNMPAAPADRGSVILAFLTGAGEVEPAIASGSAAPAEPLSFPTADVRATIGGVEVKVLSLVMAPGFVGLVQANIEIAEGLAPGDHELVITVGGWVSNGAVISVR